MPDPNFMPDVARMTGVLHSYGCDSIALWRNDENVDACDVGWGTLRVRGLGTTPVAAMEDAARRIKVKVVEKYPSVEFPVDDYTV